MLDHTIVTHGAREDENYRRLAARIYASDPNRLHLYTELDEQGIYYNAEIALDADQAQELVETLNTFIKARQSEGVTT